MRKLHAKSKATLCVRHNQRIFVIFKSVPVDEIRRYAVVSVGDKPKLQIIAAEIHDDVFGLHRTVKINGKTSRRRFGQRQRKYVALEFCRQRNIAVRSVKNVTLAERVNSSLAVHAESDEVIMLVGNKINGQIDSAVKTCLSVGQNDVRTVGGQRNRTVIYRPER